MNKNLLIIGAEYNFALMEMSKDNLIHAITGREYIHNQKRKPMQSFQHMEADEAVVRNSRSRVVEVYPQNLRYLYVRTFYDTDKDAMLFNVGDK